MFNGMDFHHSNRLKHGSESYLLLYHHQNAPVSSSMGYEELLLQW